MRSASMFRSSSAWGFRSPAVWCAGSAVPLAIVSGIVSLLSSLSTQPAVDPCYLFHPALPLAVLEAEDILAWPVEVIGDIGYLLVQAIEGVAYDPPRLARSNWYSALHSGQVSVRLLVPSSLICRYRACR